MRAGTLVLLTCGCVLAAICGFGTWWSIRIAVADWAASTGTIDGFERALKLAPEDPELRAREALFRVDSGEAGEVGQAVDDDLRLAAKMNPYNSAVLMALGLREEFQGNTAEAETWLKRAVEVDHQFKPAWTLANFYYRTRQPEKSWPLMEHILRLEPLGYDPGPVFELAWREAEETAEKQGGESNSAAVSRRIENMVPAGSERPIQYLRFLVNTKRIEAALEAFPRALAAYKNGGAGEATTLIDFAEALIANERVPQAVGVWNQLVEHGILPAEPLNPSAGKLIADPDFQFPSLGKAFEWRVNEIPGVFTGNTADSLRFEISGDEPPMFAILSVVAPVLPRASYRLRWDADGAALSSPRDPGFAFQIVEEPGKEVTQCGPLLADRPAPCDFVSGTNAKSAMVVLRYERAQGTTRVSGVMQLRSVRLEPVK